MLSVVIYINGQPITARSCHNISKPSQTVECEYKVDDGRTIKHTQKDGAVKLAIKLLEGIKE